MNRLVELGRDPLSPACPDYPIAYHAAKALHAAAKAQGSADYAAHWAGQAFALARPMGAAELVATLARETREVIERMQRVSDGLSV